jgi:hypothetical protein
MNVYRLILRRSWPCGVDARHKGHGIVYIVFGDGQKIIFQLLKEDPVVTTARVTKRPILLTEWAEFFEEVKKAQGVLALVPRGINSPTFQAILEMAITYSHFTECVYSEEVPEFQDMGGPDEGGFTIVFNLLDGSRIVDSSVTVSTIIGVWLGDELIGVIGRVQVVAVMGIYGHQTAYILHLSTNWVISSTLNLVSILEYFPQEASNFNSRTSYFQEWEIDVGRPFRGLHLAKTSIPSGTPFDPGITFDPENT